MAPDPQLLARLEAYYDSAPRSGATAETIGPFTLFIAHGNFPFYARPRLGLSAPIAVADVVAVLRRQRAVGVPETFEWVVETTPSLAGAAEAAGLAVQALPLLVLADPITPPVPTGFQVRRVGPDEPDLERIMAVAGVAFGRLGTAVGEAGTRERDALAATSSADRARFRDRLAAGLTVMVVAEDGDGPVATGAHQPVGDVSEVVGVATLPAFRRRGLGAAVTAALVEDACARGLGTIFLSAASDDVARIYEGLGFVRVAHAGFAAPSED